MQRSMNLAVWAATLGTVLVHRVIHLMAAMADAVTGLQVKPA